MVFRKFIATPGFYALSLTYPAYKILKNFDDSWGFMDFLLQGFGVFIVSVFVLLIACFVLSMIEENFLRCPKCKTKGGHKDLERDSGTRFSHKGLWQCWMCGHNWYPSKPAVGDYDQNEQND